MDKDLIDKFHSLVTNFKKTITKNHISQKLSHAEFFTLYLINNQDSGEDITTAELSRRSLITKSAVSQMVKSLEEKEYVKREIHKDDKRLCCVIITQEGKLALSEYKNGFLRILNNAFKRLGEKDSKLFMELMEKFIEIAGEEIRN